MTGVVLLDSDTLSDLSRGHPRITRHAAAYLEAHGRLTLSAISVFERLRGYRAAIARGRPLDGHLRAFVLLGRASIVLPVDAGVADAAASIWAGVGARARGAVEDILIAATASANGIPLVTRNRRDFEPLARAAPVGLELLDWSR